MSDTNREAIGQVILPVLEGLLDLIEVVDTTVMDLEMRQQYDHERRILRDRIALAKTYFAPAQEGGGA